MAGAGRFGGLLLQAVEFGVQLMERRRIVACGRREIGVQFSCALGCGESLDPGKANLRIFRIELVSERDLLASGCVARIELKKTRKQ